MPWDEIPWRVVVLLLVAAVIALPFWREVRDGFKGFRK